MLISSASLNSHQYNSNYSYFIDGREYAAALRLIDDGYHLRRRRSVIAIIVLIVTADCYVPASLLQ